MKKTEQQTIGELSKMEGASRVTDYLLKTLGDTRAICAQVTKYNGKSDKGYRELQLFICSDGRVNDITGMVCSVLGEKRGGRDNNGDFPVRGWNFCAQTEVVERLSWALFQGTDKLTWYKP